MEIRSQLLLTPEDMKRELPHIIAWLKERDIIELEVMYGTNSGAVYLEWVPIQLPVDQLQTFVDHSVEQGFFKFASSDLWIQSQNKSADGAPAAEFTLCHEADLHFASADIAFVEIVKAHWLSRGWTVYQRVNEGWI